MKVLNENIDNLKCLIRLSHFTKDESDYNTFHKAYAFGVQSVAGKILTFHVMTDDGMVRNRVPLSEIFLKEPTNDIPYHFKQLWDCFSENVTVIEYDFLKYHKAQIVLRDGSKSWGTYMFTVDWYDNPFSDEPSDYWSSTASDRVKGDIGYINERLFERHSKAIQERKRLNEMEDGDDE